MERNTNQKKLIAQTVLAMTNHPTAEEVYIGVVKKQPAVSMVTVYRNLKLLVAAGKLRRIEIPGGADRYDFNVTNHFHMRCRRCGRVFDAPIGYADVVSIMSDDKSGFLIDDHDIVFKGLCPKCKNESSKED